MFLSACTTAVKWTECLRNMAATESNEKHCQDREYTSKPTNIFLMCLCVACVVSVLTHFAGPDALNNANPNTSAAIQTTAMTKTPVPTSNTVFDIFAQKVSQVSGQHPRHTRVNQ